MISFIKMKNTKMNNTSEIKVSLHFYFTFIYAIIIFYSLF